MHAALRDFRYAARSLAKSPGLAIVAVLALGIGIGLTTMMFSIVYGALIKGLPFPEPDRIVMVQRTNPARHVETMDVTIHDLADYQAQQHSFEALAGYYSGTVNVSGGERAERYDGAFVAANTFRIVRVHPILGRDFEPADDRPGAARVTILGYGLWQSRYGGDPGIIGRSIRVNGSAYTVVGVMPDRFEFPDNARIWLPLALDPLQVKRGEGMTLNVVGRLRRGVSLDQANVDIAAIARRLSVEHKETNDGIGARVIPFVEGAIGPQPKQLLYTMLGAVGLVLLIACANVANLLLDRAAHRTKEIGVRTALGASRAALVWQFLAEAGVLAAVGTALGIGTAYGGITAFNRAIADTDVPFFIDIRLHPAVLLFAIAMTILATLAAGILPAYQSSRADISEVLKDESRGASGFRVGRLSRALVLVEIALSCGLLVAAGLTIKSIAKLRTIDYGFTTTNIFTARIGFPPATYTDTAAQLRFFAQLRERLGELPGVRAAALTSSLPGTGGDHPLVAVEGVTYAAERDYPRAMEASITPGFFETFGIPILQGRAFTPQDRAESAPVAVVNQRFVRDLLHGENPIGRRVRLGGPASKAPWMQIVGVVPDTYSGDTGDPSRIIQPALYAPVDQQPASFMSIAVRTNGAPMTLTAHVRDAVTSLNPDIPLYWVYSMQEALQRPTWFYRVFGTLFMIFGVVALFLASVGLYAVMAFSVSRRDRELGIRIALGAQRGDVLGMIVRQGAVQLAIGMTAGLALAAAIAQVLTVILFDVHPRDPAIFASVVVVLSAAGLAACLVPARRATRVDPLVVLRGE